MSESKLNIIIDSRTAEQRAKDLTRALEALEQAGIRVSRTLSNQATGNNASASSADAASRSTRRLTDDLTRAGAAGSNAGGQIEGGFNRATSSVSGLIAGLGVLATVKTAIALADEYSQMASRIRNATEDTVEYELVQQRLLATANATYRSLSEAQEVYLGMSATLKDMGYSTEQALDVAESLSLSFVINASRADQAQSAIDQLNKAMVRGKVDADAWMSIVSAADNVVQDLANNLGMTLSEVKRLGVEGKVPLDALIATLQETKDKNLELAASMSTSFADGMMKVRNEAVVLLGTLNEQTEATQKLANGLAVVGDNLGTIGFAVAAAGALYVGKSIGVATTATHAKVKATIDSIRADRLAAEIAAQRAARVMHLTGQELANARAQLARLSGMQRIAFTERTLLPLEQAYTAAVAANTAAQAANTTATAANTAAKTAAARAGAAMLGMFGGPVGLIATVGIAAAGMYMMRDSSDSAANSISLAGKSAREAADEFERLNDIQRAAAREDLRLQEIKEVEQLEGAYKKLFGAIETDLQVVGKAWPEVKRLSDGFVDMARNGENLEPILRRMQQELNVSDRTIGNWTKLQREIDNNQQALNNTRTAIGLVDQAQQRLSQSTRNATTDIEGQAKALRNASKEMEDYAKGMQQRVFSAALQAGLSGREDIGRNRASVIRSYSDTAYKSGQVDEGGKIYFTPEQQAAMKAELDFAKRLDDQEAITERNRQQRAEAEQNRRRMSSDQLREQSRLQREFERRRGSYDDLVTEKGGAQARIDAEHKQRMALIDEFANRSNGQHTAMTNWAISERQRELAATEVARAKTMSGYLDWNQTEIQLVKSRYESERKEILLLKGFTLDERQQMIDALKAAEQKALDDSTDSLRASYDQRFRIGEEFRLRQLQIEQSNLSPDQKDMAHNVARNVNNDAIRNANKPYTDLMGELGGRDPELMRLEETHQQRLDIIRDALTLEQITKDEARAAELKAEEAFNLAKRDLAMGAAMDLAGSLASITKNLMGEQSKAYKIMFAVEKGFAIAKSVMAIQAAIASGAMSGPFPQNLIAMAQVAAATASIVSNIQSVKMAGQAHDGIDYVPREGTWLLDKGERVLSPKQNSDLTNYMQRDAKSPKSDTVVSGGINITIENHTSAKFEVQQLSEFDVRIIARDEVAKGAGKAAAADLSNPNSEMSKGIKRNYQVEPRR